ncbi:MAG: tetratricopeptide repeat protein [Methylomonas sp.]
MNSIIRAQWLKFLRRCGLTRCLLAVCALFAGHTQADSSTELPEPLQKIFDAPLKPIDAAELFRSAKKYDKGDGVEQDKARALSLYQQSAEKGYAEAQLLLGIIYDQGIGVAQDYSQALFWYRQAAEQGYAKAQFNLAAMYDEGLGVAQDLSMAAGWYRKAAEQGYARAQFNLGAMYLNAEGVTQDNVEGYMWLKLAADQGFAEQVKSLTVTLNTVTPAQIKQAKKRAKEWRKRHS